MLFRSASLSEYVFWDSRDLSSISNIQFSGKNTHNQYNLSYKFRLSDIRSLQTQARSKNVSLANLSFEDTFRHYSLVLGRQYPTAGAIGRFDGLSAKYNFSDDLSVSVAAGSPYFGSSSDLSRRFYGGEIQYRVSPNLSSNFYINRGTADGFPERLAVGSFIEYMNGRDSIIVRSEYDLLYKTINQITLQLNKSINDNYTSYLLYDKRRSPFLYADRVLNIGSYSPTKEFYSSIAEVLTKSGLTEDQIYQYITSTTPYYNSLVIGTSKSINDKWSASFNLQASNLSSTDEIKLSAYDPIPITVGVKNNYSLGLHLMGQDIWREGNSPEFCINYNTGEFKYFSMTAADSYRIKTKYGANNLSVILRYDSERGYNPASLTAILRMLYMLSERSTIDTQVILTGVPSAYIGYHYDF